MRRVDAALEKLNARERLLVGVMFASFGLIGFLLTIGLTWQKSNELRESIDEERTVLTEVLAQRDTYLAKAEETARREGQLRENTVRLSSFIEDAATSAGLGRPREFRDSQEPVEGHADITRMRTTVRLTDVTFDQFKALLESIATTQDLVFIEKVSMSSGRGRQTNSNLEVEISLLTYKRDTEAKAEKK